MQVTQISLTVKQAALLLNRTPRAIVQRIKVGTLKPLNTKRAHSGPDSGYLIPLSQFEYEKRLEFIKQLGIELDESNNPIRRKRSKKGKANATQKTIEEYSVQQRQAAFEYEEIILEWRKQRLEYKGCVALFDLEYVKKVKEQKGKHFKISVPTLYVKNRAYKEEGITGLVIKTGLQNKGKSCIPARIYEVFDFYYLDQRKPTAEDCMELTQLNLEANAPELVKKIPSYTSFLNHVKSLNPITVAYFREGYKVYKDKFAPYINRDISAMKTMEWVCVDNHQLDFWVRPDFGGEKFRPWLSTIIDIRSKVAVGYALCKTPNANAFTEALTDMAIKTGILPENLYMDNGKDYNVYDINDKKLNKKLKKQSEKQRAKQLKHAKTIMQTLGINVTNAIPYNARAKVIERYFLDVTREVSKHVITYCGRNPQEKPENLKQLLKDDKYIPNMSECRKFIQTMFDGYMNFLPFGADIPGEKEMRRIDVYNKNLPEKARTVDMSRLNLIMARTTKAQEVGRNGVTIRPFGVKLQYGVSELRSLFGKKVFVKFNCQDLTQVRIISAPQEEFICTATLNTEFMQKYGANKEDIANGIELERHVMKQDAKAAKAKKLKVPAEYQINSLFLKVHKSEQNLASSPGLKRPQQLTAIGSPSHNLIIDEQTGEVLVDYDSIIGLYEGEE